MLSEIKENVQGTNSNGKENGTRINDLEQKEEINIGVCLFFILEQNEDTELKKMRRGLGTYGTTLNIPTSESQGCWK